MKKGAADFPTEKPSVERIKQFCGWDRIKRQLEIPYDRTRFLALTAFKMGGRPTENLLLRRENFTEHDDYILAHNVPLTKQFEVVRVIWEEVDEPPPGKAVYPLGERLMTRRWETRPLNEAERDPIPIRFDEPLTQEWWGMLQEIESGWLFPSVKGSLSCEYCRERGVLRDVGGHHLSTRRFQQLVREQVSPYMGDRWWPHRYRSERASQLGQKFIESLGSRELAGMVLMRFFGWKDWETALTYVRISPKTLSEMMRF